MAAVHVARALRRSGEKCEKENGKENEDPEEKKARKSKAGVALEAAAASRILVSIRRGKLVFTFPIQMMADKSEKGKKMLLKFMMEMQLIWIASLVECWRKTQFHNLKNRRKKCDEKQIRKGMMVLDQFVNGLWYQGKLVADS